MASTTFSKPVDTEVNALNNKIALLNSVQTPTAPTFNPETVASGCVSCVIKDGWAFISSEYLVFKAAGDSQIIIRGCPKPALQANIKYSGENYTQTALINAAGDCAWIVGNGTNIWSHIGSTYDKAHWFSIAYPIANT